MRGMTEPACPVCATPHAPDATRCDFCGVVFAELQDDAEKPQPQSPSLPETGIADEVAAERDASAGIVAADAPARESAAVIEIVEVADAMDGHASDAVDGTDPAEAMPEDAAAPAASNEPAATASDDDPAGAGETAASAADPGPGAPAKPRANTPSFARSPSRIRHRRNRIEWSVVAGLAALLLVQVVASDFDQLAASATTRPWLQGLCGALHCTLPAWREPQALRMLQRDVRANPQRPGTLRISASFRNDARWAQPWPRLRVTLSDADGRAIAARDFAANEYLGAAATANGIASGQVAGIAFDVVDPSPRVTAFTFEFR
jgi:hypothetical protein